MTLILGNITTEVSDYVYISVRFPRGAPVIITIVVYINLYIGTLRGHKDTTVLVL